MSGNRQGKVGMVQEHVVRPNTIQAPVQLGEMVLNTNRERGQRKRETHREKERTADMWAKHRMLQTTS